MRSRVLAIVLALIALFATKASSQSLTSAHDFATSFQNQRKILRASNGTLALVYQKGGFDDLYLAISRDGGTTWADALRLTAVRSYADAVITATPRGAGNALESSHLAVPR